MGIEKERGGCAKGTLPPGEMMQSDDQLALIEELQGGIRFEAFRTVGANKARRDGEAANSDKNVHNVVLPVFESVT